jgi:hypothetical protein
MSAPQLGDQLMTIGADELYRALLHMQIPSYYSEHVGIGVSCLPAWEIARGLAK